VLFHVPDFWGGDGWGKFVLFGEVLRVILFQRPLNFSAPLLWKRGTFGTWWF